MKDDILDWIDGSANRAFENNKYSRSQKPQKQQKRKQQSQSKPQQRHKTVVESNNVIPDVISESQMVNIYKTRIEKELTKFLNESVVRGIISKVFNKQYNTNESIKCSSQPAANQQMPIMESRQDIILNHSMNILGGGSLSSIPNNDNIIHRAPIMESRQNNIMSHGMDILGGGSSNMIPNNHNAQSHIPHNNTMVNRQNSPVNNIMSHGMDILG